MRCFAWLALATSVVLFTAWAYWPGQTGPALLDDATSVLVIGDLKAQPELAWDYVTGDTSGPLGRPVSIASFVLEKMYSDGGLAVSKRVNIVLHLLNGVLVIWIFCLLFRHIGTPAHRWLALVLGTAWLLSPLYVSTVLYVVQRMAILSTTFMLGACIAYIYWREKLSAGEFSGWLAIAVLANTLLAVFAKENAIVIIPILLLLESLWFQFDYKDMRFISGLRMLTLGLIALGALGLLMAFDYERLAAGFGRRYFTLDERLLTQTRILWDYLGQLYAPQVLRMGLYHDDYIVSTSLFDPPVTQYAVFAWLGVMLLFVVLLKWRWGRYFAMAIAWFLVGHSVESTVLPLELYFEHRSYFPGIGAFLLVGLVYASLVKLWIEIKAPLLIYLACYALWLAMLTSSQVQVWSSHPLLILNHLNAHPESFRANSDMAVQMANLGEIGEARKYSARAYAVSRIERSGDHHIRDLALACIANQPVAPDQIKRLGMDNPERPFSSVVTLHTLVKMLQDGACPEFDSVLFANRMGEIFLENTSPATASANIYLGLALLENTLQRWQLATAYIDQFLRMSPDNPQGLLMKLHFVSALGKVEDINTVRSRLLELQEQGQLTTGQQQTLSLYLE
ncbi:MAG: hypothetical protein H6991_09380 [Pseudomonadales bacterium]|nr:hypothetical protein [Pseudomonadales bacterium]